MDPVVHMGSRYWFLDHFLVDSCRLLEDKQSLVREDFNVPKSDMHANPKNGMHANPKNDMHANPKSNMQTLKVTCMQTLKVTCKP